MKSKTHFAILIRLLLVLILFSCACNLINHLPGVVSQTGGTPEATKILGESKTPVVGETVSPSDTPTSPVALSQGPRFA